jgi:curved DNA-binding protein CbpA
MSKRKKTPYQALGVGEDATLDEIKAAHRTQVVKYHPDKNAGQEEQFKEVQEAYEVLKDPKRRAYYDATGAYGDTESQMEARTRGCIAEVLAAVVTALIGNGDDPEKHNLCKLITDEMLRRKAKIPGRTTKAKEQMIRIEKIAKRFEGPGGEDNLLAEITRQSLRPLQAMVEAAVQETEDLVAALELMKQFKYNADIEVVFRTTANQWPVWQPVLPWIDTKPSTATEGP